MRAVTDVGVYGRTWTAAPRSVAAVRLAGRWWLRNWLRFAEVVGAQWR